MTKRVHEILGRSIDELRGSVIDGVEEEAPTDMVRRIISARRKPLNQLADDEIGLLISQGEGFPFILDLVMPKLEEDPLFYGGYYEGDVLKNLLTAEDAVWHARPHYKDQLPELQRRALAAGGEDAEFFAEALQRANRS